MRGDFCSFSKWTLLTCAIVTFSVLGLGQKAEAGQKSSAVPALAPASTPVGAQAIVPQLIKFSGTITDLAGKPVSGPVDVTFSLYSEESGGSPLWYESQTVNANAAGQYTALLGAMTATGVPMDLFTSGEARWLGVAVRGLPEQSRVLLVSVPYAMTSGNAEMLGGKPASDYLLASSLSSMTSAANAAAVTAATASRTSTTGTARNSRQMSITSGGTANYLAGWVDGTNLGTSVIYQDPTTNNIGIGTTTPMSPFQVNTAAVTPGLGSYTINAPTVSITPSGTLPAGSVTTALWLEGNYPSTNDWTRGLALEIGYGITGFGHYSSRLVDYSNPAATVGTRLQLQTHSGSSDTWNAGLFMDESGNVGLGTTNPTSQLDVVGTGGVLGTSISVADQVDSIAKYGYAQSSFQLNNPNFDAGAAQTMFSFGAEGYLSDSGTLANSDFYIFDPAGPGHYEAVFQSYGTAGGGMIAFGTNITDPATLSGAGVLIDSAGDVNVAGTLAAVHFVGDGSGLTNLSSVNSGLLGGLPPSSYAPAAGSTVYVSKAGDTMTGALALPLNGLLAGTTQLVLAGGKVGVGTASPTANLQVVGSNGAGSTSGDGAAGPASLLAAGGIGGTDSFGDHGGAGAQIQVSGGAGSTVTNGGGVGGTVQLTGGTGGAGTAYYGGVGGAVIINGGNGGTGYDAATPGGNGGSITLQPGGPGSPGSPSPGNVLLAPNGMGKVGIGTSSPTQSLTVAGSITITGCYYYNGTTSNVGGSCSSDARLKENIHPFASMLDRVAELQPVHFNWRASNPEGYPTGQAQATGLIAQQVEQIFPNLVTFDKNGYRQVDYGALPLLTLEGLRELKARNDSLRAQIGEAQKQILTLRSVEAAKDSKLVALAAQNRKLASEVAQLQKQSSAVAALEARLARDEAQEKATQIKLARVIRQEKKKSPAELARMQF